MRRSRKEFGVLLGFLGMCLFAGTLPATRVGLSGFDAGFLTAARCTLAGATGLFVLLATQKPIPLRSDWFDIVAGALCSVFAFPFLAALAMRTVPASHGGIVQGILPLATAATAALLAHERPGLGFWLASFLGTVIVLAFVLRENGGQGLSAGDLYLIGTVVAGALGYTFAGRLAARRMPGWEVISWQVVVLLPISILIAVFLWPADSSRVSPAALGGLAYVAFISQYAAFVVFNSAMAIGGIAQTGQIMLLQPFAIVAIAFLINGEPLSLETVIFAAAVVICVALGQRTKVSHARPRKDDG